MTSYLFLTKVFENNDEEFSPSVCNFSVTASIKPGGGNISSIEVNAKSADLESKYIIGSATGYIINRFLCGGNFHSDCDEISQEMQGCGVGLMDHNGRVRNHLRDSIGGKTAVDEGGFLYIENIKVEKEHRGQEVGLLMLQALLRDSALERLWTFAAIMPSPLNLDYDEICPPEHAVPREEAVIKLSRYYARLGFQQDPKTKDYWFLHADTFLNDALMSVEDSRLVPVAVHHPPAKPEGVDKEMIKALLSSGANETEADLLVRLQPLVAAGADVNRARALHYSCANRKRHLIFPLVSFLGADVNLQDDAGNTPLIMACTRDVDEELILLLLALGADKSICNKEGNSPYDTLVAGWEDVRDFMRAFDVLDSPAHEKTKEQIMRLKKILKQSSKRKATEVVQPGDI